MIKLILSVMLWQLGATTLFAQDIGPINTERPSFSSSPLALSAGYWQIEAGYEYTRNQGSNHSKQHTLPNALLRFGIHPCFELQLNWTGYKRMTEISAKSTGVTDATLGLKWQLSADRRPLMIGLFAGLSLPVGDTELTSDDYDPEFAAFWTFSSGLGLNARASDFSVGTGIAYRF